MAARILTFSSVSSDAASRAAFWATPRFWVAKTPSDGFILALRRSTTPTTGLGHLYMYMTMRRYDMACHYIALHYMT